MGAAANRFVGVMVAVMLVATVLVASAGCGGTPATTSTTVVAPSSSASSAAPVDTSSTTVTTGGVTTTTSVAVVTTSSSTSTSESSTTTSTEALSSAEKPLGNGHIEATGFIKKVWVESGQRKLEIDYVEMLTGDPAVKAAVADGVIKPGETLDNDYYIRNQSKAVRTFVVSNSAKIFIAPAATDEPITWAMFAGYWSDGSDEAKMMRGVPWRIERDGSTVVDITQQYLP
jgi:hypothetical protein